MQREDELSILTMKNQKKPWFRSFLNLFSINPKSSGILTIAEMDTLLANEELKRKINTISEEVDIHLKRDVNANELRDKYNKVLDNGLYHIYFEALKNGYVPCYSQQSKVNKYLIELSKTNLQSVEKILKDGFKVNYDFVRDFLYQDHVIEELKKPINKRFFEEKNNNTQIFSLPYLSKEIRKIMTDEHYKERFSKQFFTNFATLVARINAINDSVSYPFLAETITDFRIKFKDCIETYPHIIFSKKYVTFDKYLEFLSTWQENKDNFRNIVYLGLNQSKDTREEKLNNIEETFNMITEKLIYYSKGDFQKEVNSIIVNTTTISLDNDLNQSIDNNYHQLQKNVDIDDFPNLSLDDLPEEAKIILKEINKRYINLKRYDLSAEHQSQIEIMIQKHLPKTVNKFLIIMSIDEDSDIRNIEGKTPQELLLDSLNNINSSLKKQLVNLKEVHITELSAINRHSQSFGK